MARDTDDDLFPWIIVIVLGVIITAGFVIASIRQSETPNRPPTIVAVAEPIASAPTARQPSLVAVLPAPAGPPAPRVWECTVNGQKTYADAPCGPNSAVRELSPVNRMNPTPPSRTYDGRPPSPTYAPTYETEPAGDASNTNGECAALDAEVKAINERTRHRYTSQEGEYYPDRLHKISNLKYALHCDR